jgi:soluble lytic murein transglycosylase-like protein
MNAALLALLGAGLVAASFRTTAAPGLAGVAYQLDAGAVYNLAREMSARHFPDVDPLMLTAMAEIESGFQPGAVRNEPHVKNRYAQNGDASIGLMQTLFSTAKWLRNDQGQGAYVLSRGDDLMDPQTSMYFGGSYVQWLMTYQGEVRSEAWIVMSYNGGPGADNQATRHHWEKYQAAKLRLRSVLADLI